ncbi:MAG: hypothetical protein SLAVMIC_00194 [uncultured marine phage]|uniref:Uncharacterized protein n=1 Tax=uncultured marine phage TaxID=707152 RepID=A0A8D9FRC6_9VIRU|nr:MAG: hypothetical protein SLAVMIC_00194 [uncultured marine phage]
MKYLRLFEEFKGMPELRIGDIVVLNEIGLSLFHKKMTNDQILEFYNRHHRQDPEFFKFDVFYKIVDIIDDVATIERNGDMDEIDTKFLKLRMGIN